MSISGSAAIAGVFGWPIAHSLSPRLHGHWLSVHAIDGAYVPFAVRPRALPAALRALPILGLRGVNLTIPHKVAASSHMAALTPAARRIGAVNTVTVDTDGGLIGDNTDAYGFIASLQDGGWSPSPSPAVVLGAGGAARAVCTALWQAGVGPIRLSNRTNERAVALAAHFSDIAAREGSPSPAIEVVPWHHRDAALADAMLLVNATSLGMVGNPALTIDIAKLPDDATVTDIVYTPLTTDLLQAASARGLRTVDGLGMLLHQARPGFRAWFAVDPEVTPALRAAVLNDA